MRVTVMSNCNNLTVMRECTLPGYNFEKFAEVLTKTFSSPVSHYYNRTARSLRHVSIRPLTLTVGLGDQTKGWKSPWFSRWVWIF